MLNVWGEVSCNQSIIYLPPNTLRSEQRSA